EVTATRRRPQRFEDMVGQDFVVATLQKSIEAGKIAHAYLFSGPRGCGKTSSARILAKALNCESGPILTPCGTCSTCVSITKGSSLDVIEIDGASNTSVNDVRQIKDEVQFPPNSCRYKIYIIDEVHMLSTSAFNALLKTIEEPPPYVIFIFATTELHKVPATIKSRCQQFNFRLVSVDLLKQVLSETAIEAGIQAEDEALFWIAREATGSVRDAYTLFDQVSAFSDGNLTYEKIRDKLGLVGVDRINSLIEYCVDKKLEEALICLDSIIMNGVSVDQFTTDLADYFRNLLLLSSGITSESLLGQNAQRFSSKVLSSWSSIQIERALSLMLQLYRDIRYSLDSRYELELSIARLSWLSDYVSPLELKEAIKKTQNLLQGGSALPFVEADLSSGSSRQESVRSSESVKEIDVSEEDTERISDPFAALKQRIGNGFSSEPKQDIPISTAPPKEPKVVESISVPSVPFEELQEKITEHFQGHKHMLASGLAQATKWEDNGAVISFTVDTPFIHNYLEQDHKLIAETVTSLLGRPCGVEIRLDVAGSENPQLSTKLVAPPSVEIVRQMFRGTLIGEGK
ncbi:MAG TPA: DNA polymerase III subunit gamma/tau, partial [Treponemataceae bacterium]|nr:DNA polymerase III subunit gamma/tau [Treponemataceae bacterium]